LTASTPTRNLPDTAASRRSKRGSGRVQRHRLDRGGNRQLNAAFYRIAITQARVHPPARVYLERKQAEGKEPPRSGPLPQTPTRPRRLQHTQNQPRLDIGATLAQTSWFMLSYTPQPASIQFLAVGPQ
jgi:hypothetical protein